VLFAGAGVLSYAAYGSEVKTVVISNLPQDRKFVQVVQVRSSSCLLRTGVRFFFVDLSLRVGFLSSSTPSPSFFRLLCNSSLPSGSWRTDCCPRAGRRTTRRVASLLSFPSFFVPPPPPCLSPFVDHTRSQSLISLLAMVSDSPSLSPLAGQMAEEPLPSLHRHGLHDPRLAGIQRPRQVRQFRRIFLLHSSVLRVRSLPLSSLSLREES